METQHVEVMVLGTAQDGGVPQIGCDCLHCQAAWENESLRRLVSSLGLIDHRARRYWLADASPDIGQQVRLILSEYPNYSLGGILLTHAHTGHYLGLAAIGRESWNQQRLPVMCTQRMGRFLQSNQPWKQLVDLNNIALSRIEPGRPIHLSSSLAVELIHVTHRDELSDTVAFSISGPAKTLVFCPDIDRWEGKILDVIETADIALLDGTFYSNGELPDRDASEIPHPRISQSMKIFAGWDTDIHFIHLNHSNRLLRDSKLVEELKISGFGMARRGHRWRL